MTAPARVVGIGASAGGLPSLIQLFDELAPATGMAFVVIQHLAPDVHSLMDELIGRHTEMAVTMAADGAVLAADHVYIMPPGKEMILRAGALVLADRIGHGFALPIDTLFRALANDAGERAVAIVLSGAGSDGARGVVEVKQAGGVVLAESPESARFDSMPRAAVATGTVDQVGSPTALAGVLAGLGAIDDDAPPPDSVAPTPTRAILGVLHDRFAVDFTQYKTPTVTRRIQRRLDLGGIASLDDYLARLRERPDELDALYRDLLIGVTRFFRDPEAFEAVEREVIPRLLDAVPPGEPVRIWSAACATGEEAYSLAMLVVEALAARDRPLALEVLATDAHQRSLDLAAEGVYTAEHIAYLSTERIARFFVAHPGGYQVSRALRGVVRFARHDVTRDPPPGRSHLISCRNMLIYLLPAAQRAVQSLFHFALEPDGFLFLGPSESPHGLGTDVVAIDDRWKIYQKRAALAAASPPRRPPRARVAIDSEPGADPRVLEAYDQLLDLFMPPGFLIGEDRALIDSFAGAERLLRSPPRRPSGNLLELLDEELRVVVSGALRRALDDGVQVSYGGVPIDLDGPTTCTVTARVLDRGTARAVIVTFHDIGAAAPAPAVPPAAPRPPPDRDAPAGADPDEASARLWAQLDPLIALNEELLASSDALQATNEHLHTVADDHQRRLRELRDATGELAAVIDASRTGAILVDRELGIVRFTERIAPIFRLQPGDLGRRLSDLAHDLDRASLYDELAQVIAGAPPVSAQVRAADGTRYLLRIAPYAPDDAPAGAILSLVEQPA